MRYAITLERTRNRAAPEEPLRRILFLDAQSGDGAAEAALARVADPQFRVVGVWPAEGAAQELPNWAVARELPRKRPNGKTKREERTDR